jgi:hypothetical protein
LFQHVRFKTHIVWIDPPSAARGGSAYVQTHDYITYYTFGAPMMTCFPAVWWKRHGPDCSRIRTGAIRELRDSVHIRVFLTRVNVAALRQFCRRSHSVHIALSNAISTYHQPVSSNKKQVGRLLCVWVASHGKHFLFNYYYAYAYYYFFLFKFSTQNGSYVNWLKLNKKYAMNKNEFAITILTKNVNFLTVK